MKTLVATYLALLLLLGLTLLAHKFELGPWNSTIGLAIAASKALLVAWFFMSLNTSSTSARLAAIGGVLWIFFFYFLGALDVFYRPAMPGSWWK
jgi:cytochrome c oxidase subunit 4